MTTRHDVTIVIPTKNRPRVLARAVHCALAQQGVAVEVIVVDDGSTAPTEATLRSIEVGSSHSLRVIRHDESLGVADARNAGIAVATAPWIGFCDDDDMWGPTKAMEQLRAAGTRTGWTCSATMKVDVDLYPLMEQHAPDPTTVAEWILAANVVPGGASSVIARTDIVRGLGGFDPAFSTLADWDFWVRLADAGELATVDRPLLAYLVQEASMSMDTELLDDDLQRFLEKHAWRRRLHGVRLNEGNWRRYVAEMHLRNGRRFRASAEYAMAVRHGRFKAGKLALAAFVAPGWATRRLRARRRKALPPGWADQVEWWLAPLREGALDSPHSVEGLSHAER